MENLLWKCPIFSTGLRFRFHAKWMNRSVMAMNQKHQHLLSLTKPPDPFRSSWIYTLCWLMVSNHNIYSHLFISKLNLCMINRQSFSGFFMFSHVSSNIFKTKKTGRYSTVPRSRHHPVGPGHWHPRWALHLRWTRWTADRDSIRFWILDSRACFGEGHWVGMPSGNGNDRCNHVALYFHLIRPYQRSSPVLRWVKVSGIQVKAKFLGWPLTLLFHHPTAHGNWHQMQRPVEIKLMKACIWTMVGTSKQIIATRQQVRGAFRELVETETAKHRCTPLSLLSGHNVY